MPTIQAKKKKNRWQQKSAGYYFRIHDNEYMHDYYSTGDFRIHENEYMHDYFSNTRQWIYAWFFRIHDNEYMHYYFQIYDNEYFQMHNNEYMTSAINQILPAKIINQISTWRAFLMENIRNYNVFFNFHLLFL